MKTRLDNMSLRFNKKISFVSLLFVAIFGVLFLTPTSSVSANHVTYPYRVVVSDDDGSEFCNSQSECDTLCETRGILPIACFYFYGDTGLAPQKADYFESIAAKAQKAITTLRAKGGPGGCRTTEACVEFARKLLRDDPAAFFRDVYLFTVEGINVQLGGPEGEAELETIIRTAQALAKAARENIKPPSICSEGLMCFDDCNVDDAVTPECKTYLEKTGYSSDKNAALIQAIQANGGPGNCTDLASCEAYCSVESNFGECAAFAKKYGLEDTIPPARQALVDAMQKGEGPGQCKDEVSCRNYCENTDNIGECADFADKFDLVTTDELKEMRQIASAKKAGVSFPGNCKTKESCLQYCDNPTNAVVCMEFALKAGFIPKEDIEAVSKILPYLKSGGKLPGGCTTKESCDAYCGDDTHFNECVEFAVGAGFMTKEDAEIVRKTGGKTPGNCRSREACDSYCKDAAHIDECVDFAVKAGFISQEDADQAKKI